MERTPEDCARAVETCREILSALASYEPQDDAILRLRRDIEDTQVDAMRCAERARRAQVLLPPVTAPVLAAAAQMS